MTAGADILHQVQQAAGRGAQVAPWRDGALPGIELFWLVTRSASGQPEGRGIVVAGGRLPWLEGRQAMAAVVAAGVSDALTLARAACFLLLARARLVARLADLPPPWTPEQQAAITPPARTGNALAFWYLAGRPGTLQARMDVASWKWSAWPLASVSQAAQDPIALGRSWLVDAGEAWNELGIEKLVAEAASARARAALVDALAFNPRSTTRAMAALALARCAQAPGMAAPPEGASDALPKAPPEAMIDALIDALIDAMGKDAEPGVRSAAIEALTTLAHPSARPALERAARDDQDAGVRSHAVSALGKLPGP